MENYAKLEQKITTMSEDMALIKHALIGNPQFKQRGLVDIVQEHATHIEADKSFKNKLAGGVAVGTPIAVIAWHSIVEWFKNNR